MDLRLIWFKKLLLLSLIFFLLYSILKFVERLRGIIWIKKIKHNHLLIKRYNKFNKRHANKISFNEIKKVIDDSDFTKLAERPAWFELFEEDKIISFEIPWGEVYCECIDNEEYRKLSDYIEKKFIARSEKRDVL